MTDNWGRWGERDERGALNLVTPKSVLAALTSAGNGRVVSLALPIGARSTPTFPLRPAPLHMMSVDGGDFEAGAARGPNGFQFADDYIAMASHTGTHVDALSHVADDGIMYNRMPASEVRSLSGARRLSIERFRGFVGRALVLNIPAAVGVDRLTADHEITVSEINTALAQANSEIRSGDAILIHTGWLRQFTPDDTEWYEREPGIGVDAAKWLASQDIAIIGADNWAIELVPAPSGDVMPVHLICLQRYGVHLMELIDLAPLISGNVSECLLIVAPLPIRGGVGSPVNPLAVY